LLTLPAMMLSAWRFALLFTGRRRARRFEDCVPRTAPLKTNSP